MAQAEPAPAFEYVPEQPVETIPAPANDQLRPPENPPYVPPPQSGVSPIPTSSYARDNYAYYNNILGYRNPNVEGVLGHVLPLSGGWFRLGDGALVNQKELDWLWWVYNHSKQAAKPDPNALPKLAPSPSTVRVSRSRERQMKECKIAKFRDNNCGLNQNAHHGMIDFPLRTGTQSETVAGLDHRVPGAPSYMDAYTICLSAGAHSGLHSTLNFAISRIGKANNGIVRYDQVQNLSFASIDAIPDSEVSKNCKELYKKLLSEQYNIKPSSVLGGVLGGPSTIPVRGTIGRPSSGTMSLLSQYWGFNYP